ncbi:hypothetical protein M5K25_013037 [Dendrobium thyrsiflorum]|uniref:Uncharacterized protein n=1 Tax=Dendrobium thyrsiflorum TaxID=117978 RepID=A0ABD0UYW4_DENTH
MVTCPFLVCVGFSVPVQYLLGSLSWGLRVLCWVAVPVPSVGILCCLLGLAPWLLGSLLFRDLCAVVPWLYWFAGLLSREPVLGICLGCWPFPFPFSFGLTWHGCWLTSSFSIYSGCFVEKRLVDFWFKHFVPEKYRPLYEQHLRAHVAAAGN